MNRIYRLVWSQLTRSLVAVAECARGRGKRPGSAKVAAALGAAVLAGGAIAQSGPPPTQLPTGGQVARGQAEITQSGSRMDITQSSARAVLDWQTFSVGSQAQVNFAQPSASSVTLNRVLGLDPSAIHGQLRANGQVFLSNPNGVLFAPGAQVNVGGLVASTLRMGADEFMAGTLRLAGDSTAAVVNRGRIATAPGGSVALVASQVDNAGEILTPGGTAALVAGADVTLNFSGAALGYRIDQGALGAQVHAGGLVSAPDGQILISARSASQLQASAIRVPGQLQANSLSQRGGRVVLEAGVIDHSGSVSASGPLGGGEVSFSATAALVHTGRTEATGTVGGVLQANVRNLIEAGQWDATGTHTGGQVRVQAEGSVEQTAAAHWRADGGAQGGQVRVTAGEGAWLSGRASAEGTGAEGRGGKVALSAPTLTLAGAQLSADGQAGGGTVHVGGGWQGRDASLANATATTVNPSSVLSAAARQTGDGGEVVVWSQEATGFGGRIDVSAGAQGGDGGRAEVSSHGRLAYGGQVITEAPRGRPGQLLLDPRNLTISEGAGVSSFQTAELTYSGAATGDDHGSGGVIVLSGGNIVVASPGDDRVATDAGAVRLYKPDGTLVSTLTGTRANDQVGSSGITALTNGNYVVSSSSWANGAVAGAGAVTWRSGTSLDSGAVSSNNSLVGSRAWDQVGSAGIAALTNGNYLVISPSWDNGAAFINAGAVTWGSGTSGVSGVISSTNSLVGSTASDQVGSRGITVLTNGNYVVRSPEWDNGAFTNAGAVTWGSGTNGVSGVVSSTNSLVGSRTGDAVGLFDITALTNGNYVVPSPYWDNGTVSNAGAVTWGSGTSGVSGAVSSTNSLVGSTANDQVGSTGITALTNGNYVVRSPDWANGTVAGAGAVTWGSGTSGVAGVISNTNSLVGSTTNDRVGQGGVIALTNGNYVVSSSGWDNGTVTNAGAATWGSGTSGVAGIVSSTNSLVGSTANDQVGNGGVTVLTNGNYVVGSYDWDNGTVSNAGAVTWGSGTSGVSGVVSNTNSLAGSKANDQVGIGGVTALTNGNYVVSSSNWVNGTVSKAGAVTWGSGTSGVSGVVSSSNSLVGSRENDQVGSYKAGFGEGITTLTNGNYLVSSAYWDNGTVYDAGAVTWGSGTSGVAGIVSSTNSLVGSRAGDQVGLLDITVLANGSYVVPSPFWDNGTLSDAGAVTWSSGTSGVTGVISSSNSLVGSTAYDGVGYGGITGLTSGNFVVSTPRWSNGTVNSAGAVTWGSGTSGVSGVVSSTNSLVGSRTGDQVGSGVNDTDYVLRGTITLTNGSYLVLSPSWDNGTFADAGAVTWGSGTSGVSGVISSANSLVGSTSNLLPDYETTIRQNGNTVVVANRPGQGRVFALNESPPAGSTTYATDSGQDSTLYAGHLSTLLRAGTAVTLQASNDLTVNAALNGSGGAGTGGALALHAGRSVLLNASVNSGGGNVEVVANDRLANGVVNADRAAGPAVITMATGTSINAGSGTVSLELRDGAGKTHTASGDITTRDITAGRISVLNQGPDAGSGVVLQGTLTATAAAGGSPATLVVAGRDFSNATGAGALVASGAGSLWQVWSGTPANDLVGGLAFDYKQYGATYGTSTVLGTGRGLLYTLSPQATISLAGTVQKTYDGTKTLDVASLSGSNFSRSGVLSGDSLGISAAAGEFDTRSAGSGKTVSVSGLSINGATTTSGASTVPVYGYTLAATTASGAVGTIAQRALAVTFTGVNRTYDGSTAATVTTTDDRISGDALSINRTAAFADKNAGTTKAVNVSSVSLAGTDAANYTVVSSGSTTADITPRTVTVTAGNATRPQGQPNPSFVGSVEGLVQGETLPLALSELLSSPAGPTDPPGTYPIRVLEAAIGNYTVRGVDGVLTVTPVARVDADSLLSIAYITRPDANTPVSPPPISPTTFSGTKSCPVAATSTALPPAPTGSVLARPQNSGSQAVLEPQRVSLALGIGQQAAGAAPVSVTLPDGAPLPSWISIDSARGTVTVDLSQAPPGAVSLRVAVRDSAGGEQVRQWMIPVVTTGC